MHMDVDDFAKKCVSHHAQYDMHIMDSRASLKTDTFETIFCCISNCVLNDTKNDT